MKLHSAIIVLLVLACSPATAEETVELQRFSIVQAASRTILLDRVSGTTWVLEESPHLRWQAIPQDSASSLRAKRNLDTSKLKLVANARTSADAGENVLVRASVNNPTSTSADGFTIIFVPGEATVTSATSGTLKHDDDRCVWEVDRLDAGESKVFEVQVRFSKELVGKSPQLTWALRDRSGGQATETENIAVTEAGAFSDRVSESTSDNGG
ncbi:hypothetical protein CA13_00490 [Planctomycetes bacterium CA13]|uniref:DUF11 domain-containing protein n=1 Tax=Novipirellula herctigrandis TaxID=2527986 RepID=A0A5C5YVJ1_9BACT|nr:hypothetical protein CA13_00490 [Planctomycetes bacterium CA13]